MCDYDAAVAIIQISRFLKRWAFCLFAIPIFLEIAAWWMGVSSNSKTWIMIIFGLPCLVLFMKLRVPTPRNKWKDDFRSPLLVLRSFSDDHLKTGNIIYPPDFDIGAPALDNFIWQAALALWDVGRVVILQRENNTITPIFGIGVVSDNESWEADVEQVAKGAWAILLFPSNSQGVITEMKLLQKLDLLWKTVVFMPPKVSRKEKLLIPFKNFVDYKPRWEEVREKLKYHGFNLPAYDPRGMLFIPDATMTAKRFLILDHNTNSWRRICELIDPSSASSRSLIDCIPPDRSKEL
jgi:hypothetical protein